MLECAIVVSLLLAHYVCGGWVCATVHWRDCRIMLLPTKPQWLAEQEFEYIQDWPAHSPDLNIIENVWGIMAQRLTNRVFQTEEAFRKAFAKAWDRVNFGMIKSLHDSIPRRCRAVIDARGAQTKY